MLNRLNNFKSISTVPGAHNYSIEVCLIKFVDILTTHYFFFPISQDLISRNCRLHAVTLHERKQLNYLQLISDVVFVRKECY